MRVNHRDIIRVRTHVRPPHSVLAKPLLACLLACVPPIPQSLHIVVAAVREACLGCLTMIVISLYYIVYAGSLARQTPPVKSFEKHLGQRDMMTVFNLSYIHGYVQIYDRLPNLQAEKHANHV